MAFENLSDKLQGVFKKLRGKGVLTEKDLKEALKLDENSEVLLVSSEGDTDPDRYREIVWEGLCGSDKEPFADIP